MAVLVWALLRVYFCGLRTMPEVDDRAIVWVVRETSACFGGCRFVICERPTGAGCRVYQTRWFSLGGLTNRRTSIAFRFEHSRRTPAFYDMRDRASRTIPRNTTM